MTYVPEAIIELYKIDPGTESETWGNLLNVNQDRIVQASHGVLTKNVTGITSWTLDDTDFTGTESHYKAIFLFGTISANLNINFPVGKQRAMRVYNGTVSNNSTPRLVTLVGGPSLPNTVLLVHGDRISFMLREDGTIWPEFHASTMLPSSGATLSSPLNANNKAITNVPYSAAINDDAASVRWVIDFINTQIAISQVAERSRMFPIGCLVFNAANPANPATWLEFGVWVPWGNGTALFCAGTQPDVNGAVIALPNAADRPGLGTYFSELSQANLPPVGVVTRNPSDDTGGFSHLESTSSGSIDTTFVALGTSAPFYNIPPLSVAYVWRRTA